MSLTRKALLGFAGAIAALALTPQAVLAGTVVASSGPSANQYPVGTQISDTQRITLRQGDSITVLQNGTTRVFRGPGTFVLARRGARTDNSALASLTTRRSGGQARVASSRGVPGMPRTNHNLWQVDVAKSGTICLANPDPLQLWRSLVDEEETYSVTRAGAPDETVSVTFPERGELGVWDSAIQVREGETYTVSGGTLEEPTELTFVFLQDVPTDDGDALALALIENGCSVQLDQMATVLREQ